MIMSYYYDSNDTIWNTERSVRFHYSLDSSLQNAIIIHDDREFIISVPEKTVNRLYQAAIGDVYASDEIDNWIDEQIKIIRFGHEY